jgi:hypothetical protein
MRKYSLSKMARELSLYRQKKRFLSGIRRGWKQSSRQLAFLYLDWRQKNWLKRQKLMVLASGKVKNDKAGVYIGIKIKSAFVYTKI